MGKTSGNNLSHLLCGRPLTFCEQAEQYTFSRKLNYFPLFYSLTQVSNVVISSVSPNIWGKCLAYINAHNEHMVRN